MKILVPLLLKPNLDAGLRQMAFSVACALSVGNPDHEIRLVIEAGGPGDKGITNQTDRCRHMAAIRQRVIDNELRDDDWVFWFDADIIRFPLNLPSMLIERSGGGVAAPIVNLEGHPNRNYDIAGFVEKGKWSNIDYPWFEQRGPVYELESVGAVYIVPSSVYRDGGKYEPSDRFTEHMSICRKARSMGLPVRAFYDLRAVHADLNKYGEQWHEGRL